MGVNFVDSLCFVYFFFRYLIMKLFLCLTDTDHAKGGPQTPIANTGITKGTEIYNVVYTVSGEQWLLAKGKHGPRRVNVY